MVSCLLGGHDHVLVVRQHDDLVRRHRFDRRDQVGRRRIHRLAAIHDPGAAALEERTVPGSGRDGDHRGRFAIDGHRVQQPVFPLQRLHVHVRDLEAADRTARDTERQSAAWIIGVNVHLERALVADDEQRITDLLELGLERRQVEIVTLDDEDRAVAKAGKLLVNRVEADPFFKDWRVGKRLAGDDRGDPAHDLDEPCRTGVDDARLAQHGQELARLRDRLVADRDDLGQRQPALGGVSQRADRGQHRPLDRFLHRPVGRVARRPKRPGEFV